jgi:dinuclear metal center YbgI/SA1388 family protein
MTTVASVLARLSAKAPGDKAAGWDTHGLQIGDPAAEVLQLAICHEVTERVADLAVAGGVDLLVSYHPLLFKPTTLFVAGPGPAGRAYRLARAGVGVAVIHTAWDAAKGGTADSLARALGLTAVTRFGAIDPATLTKLVTFVPRFATEAVATALAEAGAGQIGNYSGCTFRSQGIGTFVPGPGAQPIVGDHDSLNEEPEDRLEVLVPKAVEGRAIAALVDSHPYDEPAFDLFDVRANLGLIGRVGNIDQPLSLAEFADRVTKVLEVHVRCAGDRDRGVARVAVLPGSGGSFIGEAAGSGANAYVSGDLSHHHTRAALDLGMSTIDPGHAATERPGVVQLLALARTIMPDVIDLTDDATPWKEN